MKTLFPKQEDAHRFFTITQRQGHNTLDTSDAGTGKTVVAAALAKSLGHPVAVLCPKQVIPSWERELKDMGVDPLFVINYEKIRGGRTKWMTKSGKKIMKWMLPMGTLLLVDEIHKCKGPYTQNAQLVLSLVNQGYQIHGMSATAAEDPTEMRSLGYMLKLHSLNKADKPLRSWYSWMTRLGCEKDFWNQWRLTKKSKLKDLRESMYGISTDRLSVQDLPDAFKENRIFVEPIQFKNLAKIKKAYKDLGLTPEILEQYIENGTVENSEHVIVNIIRARQLAETLKVPDLVEMAEDLMLEGLSVVTFVSFKETVESLCEKLQCDRIEGSQKSDRQQVIDDFQADKTTCIVVNTAAGGTGISLHDVNGERPRVSLISPQFSAKDHVQVLGRIHRNGMKSDALQKILVASGSVEEAVMSSMQRRLDNLAIMQNQK
jgi:superfamily II DNA or RNA helicase